MKKCCLLICLLLIIFNFAQSQTDKTSQTIEDLIEDIAAETDEELDYSTLYDDLNYFLNYPLNLNSATKEDLEKLQFVNELQIQNLLKYVAKNGNMLTIYELQLIDGFESEDIQRILPFVTVEIIKESSKIDLRKALKYGSNQIFIRQQFILQQQSGYLPISDSILENDPDKNRYLGNRHKHYVKYKYHYKNRIFIGATMEKDPGEEFFAGTQKQGFDYYSAHLQIEDISVIKRLIIGDYQTQFGQGLVLWSGMGGGKSSYPLNIKKKAQGLKKYSSADENLFMRGAGVILKFNKIELSTFVSHKYIDANTAQQDSSEGDSEDIESLYITSFQNTGYHATPNEIADKHTITETVYGTNLTFRGDKYKIGATAVAYQFGTDINKDIKPYNQFEQNNNKNANLGLDYHFILQDINVFGEVAASQNGGMAIMSGALIPMHPQISLATVYRKYQKDYQAYYSSGFSEGGKTSNEEGIYLGTEIYPYKKWKIAAYMDSFSFEWLKSRQDSPSKGADFFLQIDYNLNRNVDMYWKMKHEIKQENNSDEQTHIKYLEEMSKTSFRYHLSYNLKKWLTLKNRVEYSIYHKANVYESGFMMYQDIKIAPLNVPLSLYFRYGIFDAPYNARFYAYENDVLYAFSVPGYYYKGFRTYMTLSYDFTDKITIWLRYGQFSYSDRNIISENSLNEIQGNTKSELKAQLRIKF